MTHGRSGGVVVPIAVAVISLAACGGCSSSSLARLRSAGAPGGRVLVRRRPYCDRRQELDEHLAIRAGASDTDT